MSAKKDGKFETPKKTVSKKTSDEKTLENKAENDEKQLVHESLFPDENQTDYIKTEENKAEIGIKEPSLPIGDYSLFHLEKLDHITFRAAEVKIVNGSVADIQIIGENTFDILKHKMHRRIYESAQAVYVQSKKDEFENINKPMENKEQVGE